MKCENVPIYESCASSAVKPLLLLTGWFVVTVLMSDNVDSGDPPIRVAYRILKPGPGRRGTGGTVVLSIINALGEIDRDATKIQSVCIC